MWRVLLLSPFSFNPCRVASRTVYGRQGDCEAVRVQTWGKSSPGILEAVARVYHKCPISTRLPRINPIGSEQGKSGF